MNNSYEWYSQLLKPTWAPPSWLFGPAWTVLYVIIFITYGKVLLLAIQKRISPLVLVPFVLNLFFNFIFTPIQFGLRNNLLAAVDIVFLLGTLIWAMVAIYPHARWISYALIPYLLWVSFATVLQFSVTYLNR